MHVPADLFFLTLGMKTSVLMEIMPEISCSTTHFTFQHTSRPVFCTVQHLQLCIFGAAPLTMPQIVESISADTKSRRREEKMSGTACVRKHFAPLDRLADAIQYHLYLVSAVLPCYQEAFLHGADEQCDQDFAS